jgi:hypothetical protein
MTISVETPMQAYGEFFSIKLLKTRTKVCKFHAFLNRNFKRANSEIKKKNPAAFCLFGRIQNLPLIKSYFVSYLIKFIETFTQQ